MSKVRIDKNRSTLEGAARSASAAPVPARRPGATRYSTVVGLMESPSDRKWSLFLREGPYWSYLVNYLQRKNIFRGRRDRVEEAVMNTCEKVGKFMVSKRYKYPEEGKGYFRGFLKAVALHTALDLCREISRQEQVLDNGADADAERDLDAYDAAAGLKRAVASSSGEKRAGRSHGIVRLDDNPFSDDEAPSNYNPAEMFDFRVKVSKENLGWVRKLQVHVLYIALGHVLTNAKVSAERREMLRLRYGLDMTMKDIHAMPRFATKSREALDAQMSHAKDELRKEAASWWKLVAPNENDFADETVLKFWRELERKDDGAKTAIKLQDKAIGIAGRIR